MSADARMKIKAAAYGAIANGVDWRDVIRMLNAVAREIEDMQWSARNGGDR